MANKSKRSSSRKARRTHMRKNRRRTCRGRRRGGADALSGAPTSYHLSGSWPSRMSLGQGADYFKYHEGQHGGAALGMGPYPAAVMSPGLPDALRGPAHIGGIDKAISEVQGLCDPPNCPTSALPVAALPATTGGKRRRRLKHRMSLKRHRKGRKDRTRHRKRRGGALGYAPFPGSGMLLSSPRQYAEAGLNPEWKTDVAFTDADVRESQ